VYAEILSGLIPGNGESKITSVTNGIFWPTLLRRIAVNMVTVAYWLGDYEACQKMLEYVLVHSTVSDRESEPRERSEFGSLLSVLSVRRGAEANAIDSLKRLLS
jgi:hypothetical protein